MSESSEFTALRDVLAERKRQDAKWGEQNHDPFTYLTILGEEYGETCQAALHARFSVGSAGNKQLTEHLRMEAVQTAAVALAIVECIDRKKWRWNIPPPTPCTNNDGHECAEGDMQ
jgi:NTP pyrophosphatase (non-canonical NTP hydrolase)